MWGHKATMLLIFPVLSLKQCDMEVSGGLIFFPRWVGEKNKKNQREEEMYPGTGFGHQNEQVSQGE